MARALKHHRKTCEFKGQPFTKLRRGRKGCTCDAVFAEFAEPAATLDDVIEVPDGPSFEGRVLEATRVWKTIYLEDPPEGFDAAMRALFLLGADDGLVTYAITVTATQLHVEAKFPYMAGIVRSVLGRTLDAELAEDD